MTDPTLSTVRPDDWSVLTAIARRILRWHGSPTDRSDDEFALDVHRSAQRLAGYVSRGELTIEVRVPDEHEAAGTPLTVWLTFDDGLEPIVFPWNELDLDIRELGRSLRRDT